MYLPSVKCHGFGGRDQRANSRSVSKPRLTSSEGAGTSPRESDSLEGKNCCCQGRSNCWKYLCDDSFFDSNVSFCVEGERHAGWISWFDFLNSSTVISAEYTEECEFNTACKLMPPEKHMNSLEFP